MSDRPKGAIIQRDKKTYGVIPITFGMIIAKARGRKTGHSLRAV